MTGESEDYTTKSRNLKYSIGQEVVIVDDGVSYPTYFDWITDNKLCLTDDKIRKLWSKYLEAGHNDCETGTILTVVATGCHCMASTAMYLCEDSNGNPVLIDENGLDILEKEDAKMLNRIVELEKRVAELKSIADFQTSSNMDRYFQLKRNKEQLAKAKEIILKLYNAGRDVLMCRTEEKVYDNLSEAINDRSIELFLEEKIK